MARDEFPDGLVTDLAERAGGRCELDGLSCTYAHHHHRQPRQKGGRSNAHRPSNLLRLHPGCHLARVESDRASSYGLGWLVHGWCDPEEVPVFTWRGWRWLRDDLTMPPVSVALLGAVADSVPQSVFAGVAPRPTGRYIGLHAHEIAEYVRLHPEFDAKLVGDAFPGVDSERR